MSTLYTDLITNAAQHCKNKGTGCSIYLSNESLSGKIFIKTGRIVNIQYGGTSGIASIPMMAGIETVDYEFKGLPVIITPDTNFPDTDSLLNALMKRQVSLLSDPSQQGGSVAHVVPIPSSNSQTKIQTSTSNASTLTLEQKKIIRDCLMKIIGPIADFLADEHLSNASSINDAFLGLQDDIDSDSYQQLHVAVAKALK